MALTIGGTDFTLCLWDILSGTLLQKFCVQAGEIAQLLVPPANSSVKQQLKCLVQNDLIFFEFLATYITVHL